MAAEEKYTTLTRSHTCKRTRSAHHTLLPTLFQKYQVGIHEKKIIMCTCEDRWRRATSPPMFCNVMAMPAAIFPGVPKALQPSCSYARIPDKHRQVKEYYACAESTLSGLYTELNVMIIVNGTYLQYQRTLAVNGWNTMKGLLPL